MSQHASNLAIINIVTIIMLHVLINDHSFETNDVIALNLLSREFRWHSSDDQLTNLKQLKW
jgi:hypothetical protein